MTQADILAALTPVIEGSDRAGRTYAAGLALMAALETVAPENRAAALVRQIEAVVPQLKHRPHI